MYHHCVAIPSTFGAREVSMKRLLFTAAALVIAANLVPNVPGQEVSQAHHAPTAIPACPPGCQVVAEVCYRDVCRQTTEVRQIKKWVYSCKEEPFCVPSCKGMFSCG